MHARITKLLIAVTFLSTVTAPVARAQSVPMPNSERSARASGSALPSLFYINKKGEQAVPYSFHLARPFSEGLAPVLIDNQWGYIDKAGNLKIGARFTHARSFSEGLAAVKVRDDWGYINPAGEVVIKPRFATADDFKDGRAVVDIGRESPEFPAAAQKRLDDIVKDPQTSNLKKALMAIAGSRKAGIIDRTGTFIIPAEFSTVDSFSDDLALVRKEQQIEFLGLDGKTAIKLELYDDARPFSDGMAAVKQKDLWGFINTSGRLTIKPKFEQVQDFHHDLAPAKQSGKWGFIDKRGEWTIKPSYDYVWEGFENGVAVVGNDLCPVEHQPGELTRIGGEYIVSKRTEVESQPDDSITPFAPSRFAYPDYRFALIDQQGKEQTKMNFDLIGSLSNGVRSARIDGQFGFIDNMGNVIVKPNFRWVSSFSDDLALVQEGKAEPREVERNLQLLKNNTVPAVVNDPKLIKQDIEICSKVIAADPTNVLAYRDRGYLKCSLSEFKDSLEDFRQVDKLCPVSADGSYWLGMAELQLGDYKDAVVSLSNALENERTNARTYYARAKAFSELGEYELALRDINQAIALDDHPFFQGVRGTIYEKSGKAEKGLSDLQIGRRAPILDPWPTGAKSQQEIEKEIQVCKEKAKEIEAAKKDDKLLALADARWADGLDSLRRLKLREQKLLELEELYKECLELRRNSVRLSKSGTANGSIPLVYKDDLANALAQLSSWYVRVGRYDEAAKLLEEAMQIVKDLGSTTKEADFLNDLGKVYLAQDKYDEAEKSFEKALSLTENQNSTLGKIVRGQTLNALSALLTKQKKTVDAKTRMDEASKLLKFGTHLAFLPSPPLSTSSTSAQELYEFALQSRGLGLIETSRDYMRLALEKTDSNDLKKKAERFLDVQIPKTEVDLKLTKTYQKGRTAEAAGDFPSAEQMYRDCMTNNPDFEWSYVDLARLKRLTGELGTADKLIKKALALNPDYMEGWLEQARICKARGEEDKAKEALDKAVSLDPDSQLAQFEQKHLSVN